MAKPRAANGVTLTYPATTTYKQWVWKEIRRRGWTLQKLVDEMKRVARAELMAIVTRDGPMYDTISTSALSQLLGPAPEKNPPPPPPTNCAFMPALNKALGIEPPPVCDPTDEMQQLVERFKRAWTRSTPRERAMLVAAIGPDDDQGGMDGNRAVPGDSSGTAQRARR